MLSREWLRGFGKAMINIVYPEKEACQLCERPIERENGEMFGEDCLSFLCENCRSHIELIVGQVCNTCGRPDELGVSCRDCMYRQDRSFVFSRSAAVYNEAMKELIARYKYRGDRKMEEILGTVLYEGWKAYYAPHMQSRPIHLLTFVPLHEDRLFQRTFNQSQELAEQLSRKIGIPVADLLVRDRATDKQSKQGREARLQALRGAFRYRPGLEVASSVTTESIRILLIDDVYTTGATLNEAARVIRRGLPNAKVYGLTVAR